MTEHLTIDLSKTVGQSSAIKANSSSIFTIRVTSPVVELPPTHSGEAQEIPGFGIVVSGGPVNGHEVLYTSASVVPEATGLRHADGLVVFA